MIRDAWGWLTGYGHWREARQEIKETGAHFWPGDRLIVTLVLAREIRQQSKEGQT